MKKIFIIINNNSKFIKISNKMPIKWYRYYDGMLMSITLEHNEYNIGMIELYERDIHSYIIILNTMSIFIMKRNNLESLIIVRKNNKNRYYIANKVFGSYYANSLCITIKENSSTLIKRYDDIGIYLTNIRLKIKFSKYDYSYENYKLDIYKIKRIIDWKNFTFVL